MPYVLHDVLFIHRKSTQLVLSVRRGHRVVTFGDVPLSKCYFLRKYIVDAFMASQLNSYNTSSNCRLPNSQNASVMSGGGFMRGTKFRYSGRTEREILTENLNALRQQHLANNTSPSKRKANSVPATPSSPQGDLAEIRNNRKEGLVLDKTQRSP